MTETIDPTLPINPESSRIARFGQRPEELKKYHVWVTSGAAIWGYHTEEGALAAAATLRQMGQPYRIHLVFPPEFSVTT